MRASLAFAAVALIALTACHEETPPAPPPPAPEITSFTASPAEVEAGQKTTLAWQTKNATAVEITQLGVGVVSGVSGASGQVEVMVEQSSLFVLKAKNERGVEASAATSVQIHDAVTDVVFLASPTEVAWGEPVTVAWSAPGARSVTLAEKNGAQIDIGAQLEVGVVTVKPVGSTTYILTVDGNPWEREVLVAPAVGALASTPAVAMPGEPITIAWQTAGAGSVSLRLAGVGTVATETDLAKAADGSFTFPVPASIDPGGVLSFSLVAKSLEGKLTSYRELSVFVAGTPKVREWTVPTYGVEGGNFTVGWTTSGATSIDVVRDGVVVHTSSSLTEAAKGSFALPTLATDSTLKLVARDDRGSQDVSEEKTVSPVGLPVLVSFAPDFDAIARGGDPVTLSWEVTNARVLTIEAVGQGELVRSTGTAAAAPGSITVYPNANTEYVLTAENGAGNRVVSQRTVSVTAPVTLSFSHPLTPAGAPIDITGTGVVGGGAVTPWNFALKNLSSDAFVDISGTGSLLPFLDGEGYDALLAYLPETFTTTLFGTPISARRVNVSINGWLSFRDTEDDGPYTLPGTTFPNPELKPLTVMPFLDDLAAGPSTRVYYQLDGQGSQQRLIIQWSNVFDAYSTSKIATFQAQIYASGDVVFAYGTVSGFSKYDSQFIGVQNADNTGGALLSSTYFADGKRPTAGDTFHFFGSYTLPLPIMADNRSLIIKQAVGQGSIFVAATPGIFAAGQLRLSEVMYNPAPGKEEWFEVESLSTNPIDLNGWTIDFGNGATHTVSQSLILPAGGRLLFGQSPDSAEASAGGPAINYVYGTAFAIPDAAGSLGFTIGSGRYTSLVWAGAGLQGRSWQFGAADPSVLVATDALPLTCSGRTAFGSGTQMGSPGAANTHCFPYSFAKIAGAFTPIAATGAPVPNMQNGPTDAGSIYTALALATPITYAGQSFGTLYVSANGFVSLQPLTSSYANNDSTPSLSAPNGVIAPFWDDLDENSTAGTGGVYWQQFDPDSIPGSGDEYTLVSWENWKRASTTATSSLNFQVKFLANGNVEFQFGTLTSSTADYANGKNATTWIETPDGSHALKVNVNASTAPGIQANTGYRFTYLP